MKALIVCLTLLLSACSTLVPVKPHFPEAPKELFEKCPNLNQADPNTQSVVELLKVVVENYELYYLCAIKQETWAEWYNAQRAIFEEAYKK